MKFVSSSMLAICTYILMSGLLYGSVISPIWFATVRPDHLGVPFWVGLALCMVGLSAYLAFFALKGHVAPTLRPSLFVASTLTLCTLAVGGYAEVVRAIEIRRFSADQVVSSSFFKSLHEVPRDFQLYLHAAALKGCVPYAWSYGEMAFYRLKPNVAINVLPPEWIERCAIRQTDPS